MTLRVSREFDSYVTLRELPQIGDARQFLLVIPFKVEGAERIDEMSWPWEYSAEQQAVDQREWRDGFQQRLVREIAMFRRHLEYELAANGLCIYEIPGRAVLVRGPRRSNFNEGRMPSRAASDY